MAFVPIEHCILRSTSKRTWMRVYTSSTEKRLNERSWDFDAGGRCRCQSICIPQSQLYFNTYQMLSCTIKTCINMKHEYTMLAFLQNLNCMHGSWVFMTSICKFFTFSTNGYLQGIIQILRCDVQIKLKFRISPFDHS